MITHLNPNSKHRVNRLTKIKGSHSFGFYLSVCLTLTIAIYSAPLELFFYLFVLLQACAHLTFT